MPDPKQRAVLEIPEGAVFEMEQDGLVLGFRDDVVIRGNIGHRIKKIFSDDGSIELRSPNELVVEMVETKRGQVLIAGSVRARSVKGARVTLLEGKLSARSVNGEASVELKGGTIEADMVMSPEVQVSLEVRGRATVIECQNELGPHKLRGGFRMAEFLEMMPNAQKVIQSEASALPALAARVTQVSESPSSAPARPIASEAARAGGPAWTATVRMASSDEMPAASAPATVAPPSPPVPSSPPPAPRPPAPEVTVAEETTAAPTEDAAAAEQAAPEEVAAEEAAWGAQTETEAAPPEEPPPPPERPPFHAALAEMCAQIARVYGQQKFGIPPPVQRLIDLIEAGEYVSVKGQLTQLWNQLIAHHKETKQPFAVKTTQMFQGIQRTLAQNV